VHVDLCEEKEKHSESFPGELDWRTANIKYEKQKRQAFVKKSCIRKFS
jgi:hypothetical protein